MSYRVVFMGTPEWAVPTLDALGERHQVALVVTQPDRPRGRSRRPEASPVKERALEAGIPVVQPERRDQIAPAMEVHAPFDVGVVVAYGKILPPEALAMPRQGILNVHFSLLPRWRGAAPVARALIAGDPMTGVTILKMDEGLDTGPVLTAQAVDISPEEDAGELTGRLARLGAALLVGSLPQYLRGELAPVPQSDEGLTYAEKITPEDRPLRPDMEVEEALNRVRGLAPEPGATLTVDGETYQVLAARRHHADIEKGRWYLVDGVPVVGFADGAVELVRIQPPGRKAMDAGAWARGARRERGVVG